MKKIKILFLLFIAFFVTFCKDKKTNIVASQNSFFDVKKFISSEAKRLQSQAGRYEKKVTVDGATEEKISDSLNWTQELALFAEADINRPAWKDKYRVDSIFDAQHGLVKISYTTQDKNLKTKQLDIIFNHNILQEINIKNSASSAVATLQQQLSYRPDDGYLVEMNQKIPFSDPQKMTVAVRKKK